MNQLYEFDHSHYLLIAFNNLLPDGKSFFTSIEKDITYINEVIDFLLDQNVDPNKPDKNGSYPLQKEIELSSTILPFN